MVLRLPMRIRVHTWEDLGKSVSVRRGPLTYSLKIEPRREVTETYGWSDEARAFAKRHDFPVERLAGTEKWPAYNLYPEGAWNYALDVDKQHPDENLQVVQKGWSDSGTPFRLEDAPVLIKARARRVPTWGLEKHNLTEKLPTSPVKTGKPMETITLVPMGAARLRITAFPVAESLE